MNYRKVVLMLVLVLAGGSVILWFNAQAIENTFQVVASNSAVGSFLSLDYIKEDAVIHQELALAKTQAREWQSDAKLVAISMKFENGLSYEWLKQYNYVFSSQIDPSRYLIVNNHRIKNAPSQTYAEDDLFDKTEPVAVPEEFAKINFVQALEIVERNGGSDFRIAAGGNCAVALLLMQPEGGVLNWHISYSDQNSAKEKTWQVNAANGAIQGG